MSVNDSISFDPERSFNRELHGLGEGNNETVSISSGIANVSNNKMLEQSIIMAHTSSVEEAAAVEFLSSRKYDRSLSESLMENGHGNSNTETFFSQSVSRSGRKLKKPQLYGQELIISSKRKRTIANTMPSSSHKRTQKKQNIHTSDLDGEHELIEDDHDSHTASSCTRDEEPRDRQTVEDVAQPMMKKRRKQNTVAVNSRPLTYEEYLIKHVPADERTMILFCTMCGMEDDGHGNDPILICDNCQSSYHKNCHKPRIEEIFVEDDSVPWYCLHCIDSEKAIKDQEMIKFALESYQNLKVNDLHQEDSSINTENDRISQQNNHIQKCLDEMNQITNFSGKNNEQFSQLSDKEDHDKTAVATPEEPSTPALNSRKGPGRPKKGNQLYQTCRAKVKHEIGSQHLHLGDDRCISCGTFRRYVNKTDFSSLLTDVLTSSNNQTVPSNDISNEDMNMAANEHERPALPEDPSQIATILFNKMCIPCVENFQKHLKFLKTQSSDLLALLLVQTSLRYNYLEEFIRVQEAKQNPFQPQQLLAYSAKSRYITIPSLSVIKLTHGYDDPLIHELDHRLSKKKSRPVKLNVPKLLNEPETPIQVHEQTSSISTTPAETPNSSLFEFRRRPPSAFGSYEDMIARAILTIGNSRGSKPKEIFAWMENNIPGLAENFRGSATQALKKGCDRGRFIKVDSGWYRMNPNFEEKSNKKRKYINEFDFQKFPQTPHTLSASHAHNNMTPTPNSVQDVNESNNAVAAAAAVAQHEALLQVARRQTQDAANASAAVAAAASLPLHYGNHPTAHTQTLQPPHLHNSSFPHHHMMMTMPYPNHPAFFHHQTAFAHPHSFHAQHQAMQAAAAVAAAAVGDQTNSLDNVLAFQNQNTENSIF